MDPHLIHAFAVFHLVLAGIGGLVSVFLAVGMYGDSCVEWGKWKYLPWVLGPICCIVFYIAVMVAICTYDAERHKVFCHECRKQVQGRL